MIMITLMKMRTARMARGWLALAAMVVSLNTAFAGAQKFDFKDPKGVNNAAFTLDAPLEAISGTANGVSGTVEFDPTQPSSIKGKIVIASSSMHVPNPMMKEHMHSEGWMDVAKHPEISFEVKQLKNVKTTGDVVEAEASGVFTARGVSKEMTVPVKLTYLKDKLGARTNGQMQGDLLVIRSSFSIKRSDFGINPKAPQDKVSDSVEIVLSVAGSAPRS